MKKLLATLTLAVPLIFGGCMVNHKDVQFDRIKVSESVGVMSDKTIYISGNFYEGTFTQFMEATKDELPHYTIVINSNGGDGAATIGIMSRILELQKKGTKFTTVVYTKAASAGSFIWMLGDHRVMHSGSYLMFHTLQAERDAGEKSALPNVRLPQFQGMDEFVIRHTIKAFPNVDPMTLETMLRYSGMTFIMAEDCYKLGMVDELITN